MRNPYEDDFRYERGDGDGDGVACQYCGTDGDVMRVSGHDEPLCAACWYDLTESCASCGVRVWLADMDRVFGTANLYCLDCASQQPGLAGRDAAARQDERRG